MVGAERMSATELNQRPISILLVEDNPDDAFLLERHLKREGLSVRLRRVDTAQEMEELLRQSSPPDIVLADYKLPSFSGPEALKLLRSLDQDIPFIMMSGVISEETAVEAMRAGANDYVSKQNLARLVPAIQREICEAATRRSQRAMEEALRTSKQRFDRLVEAMPMGLFLCDVQGQVLYANEAAEHMLGFEAGLLASEKRTLQTICPPLSKAHAGLQQHTLQRELFETTCTKKDGSTVEVLAGITVLNPHGRTEDYQMAVFLADLTTQKRSEELLRRTEKLAAAGRLAATIAHEINNPLEALTNLVFLARSQATGEVAQLLSGADQELQRVAHIARQTLNFYRAPLSPQQFDLAAEVEQVVSILTPHLRNRGLSVTLKLQPIQINGVPGEIRQVLSNLIMNSADASKPGGEIRIRVKQNAFFRNGSREDGVSVLVADSGQGMTREVLKKIFEPFFTTKKDVGTGLGLWISKEIVDRHRGWLRVRSRIAQGTVVRMVLPLASS